MDLLLSVRTVLEGGVCKEGKRLRITVQLIDALDGYHLWSASYERTMKDFLALQEEISGSIVEALKRELISRTDLLKSVVRAGD